MRPNGRGSIAHPLCRRKDRKLHRRDTEAQKFLMIPREYLCASVSLW